MQDPVVTLVSSFWCKVGLEIVNLYVIALLRMLKLKIGYTLKSNRLSGEFLKLKSVEKFCTQNSIVIKWHLVHRIFNRLQYKKTRIKLTSFIISFVCVEKKFGKQAGEAETSNTITIVCSVLAVFVVIALIIVVGFIWWKKSHSMEKGARFKSTASTAEIYEPQVKDARVFINNAYENEYN